MMDIQPILVFGWLIVGMIGAAIGHYKNRFLGGLVLGLLLGPLGWLLVLVGPTMPEKNGKKKSRPAGW